jgi:hypothetical protein
MHHLETLIQSIPPGVFASSNAASGGDNSAPQISSDSATSPLASFASSTHTYPSGVPPPSLHVFPLLNPSTHFTTAPTKPGSRSGAQSPTFAFQSILGYPGAPASPTDDLTEHTSRMSLSPSYLYFDDEGYTRWQGETSGLPLLDLLIENYSPTAKSQSTDATNPNLSLPKADKTAKATNTDWFPNRTPRRTDVNPGNLWRLITSSIVPDLMDRCV